MAPRTNPDTNTFTDFDIKIQLTPEFAVSEANLLTVHTINQVINIGSKQVWR